MATFIIPVTEYGNDSSSVSLPVPDGVADAALTDLFNAVDGVIIGNLGQSTLNVATPKDTGPGGNSADPYATRKLKWLCRYHDAVTLEKLQLEIACPDMNLLTGNTDFADLSAGAGLAFKGDFELSCFARRTGNAVVLDSVELRGRNLKSKKD